MAEAVGMATEIERKFLLAEPPDPSVLGPGVALRQGYVAEDGTAQVRVRIAGDAAFLTVKVGRGVSRTEVEVPLTLEAAEALWPHTAGRRIEKVRHRVEVDRHVAEVDLYGGALEGLCTAEVEFASEAEAARFRPPPWFGRDVTLEPGWDNASLARHGRPQR